MDCTDIKVLLSGLIDDELDAETRHAAERHITGCAACRTLVGDAESLTQLIVTDTDDLGGAGSLPDGFAGSVLSRTVYADYADHADHRPPRIPARWTNWLGWLAAAAAIGLATTIWILEQTSSMVIDGRGGEESIQAARPMRTEVVSLGLLHSSIHDGDLPEDEVDFGSAAGGADDQGIIGYYPILRRDADTLDQAAQLLDRLVAAGNDSFAQIEVIRRVADYTGIVDRMARARERLPHRDHFAILASESVLLRILNGPIDQTDLQDLRDAVQTIDLSNQLMGISARATADVL